MAEGTQIVLDMLDQSGDDSGLDSDNELGNDIETADAQVIPIQELGELKVDNLDVTPPLKWESMFLYSLYVFHKMRYSHVYMTR